MTELRDAFFDDLYKMATYDKKIIFLTADADAFSLKKFKKDMPDRFINVGVSEQNAILVATGLAMADFKPYVYSITPFLTARCYEQIKVGICSHNLPVTLIGLGAGLVFGFDGPTHHAMHDIGIMRILPEMNIYNVSDNDTARISLSLSYKNNLPAFIRLDKGNYPEKYIYSNKGNLRKFEKDKKIVILTTGTILHTVLKVSEKFNATVFDIFQLNPISKESSNAIVSAIDESTHVFVIEEHTNVGGLYDIICQHTNKQIHSISLPHAQLFDYGDRNWLLAKYGLDELGISKKIEEVIK